MYTIMIDNNNFMFIDKDKREIIINCTDYSNIKNEWVDTNGILIYSSEPMEQCGHKYAYDGIPVKCDPKCGKCKFYHKMDDILKFICKSPLMRIIKNQIFIKN